MSVLEIIGGVLLIISSILIILMVMMQESQSGGLGGAMQGVDMAAMMGRGASRNMMLAKYTKIAAIVFFAITLLVDVVAYLT